MTPCQTEKEQTMIRLIDMTPEQVRALGADELIEEIAQMFYDRGEIAQDAETDAITQLIKDQYHAKALTYFAAAEHVRNLVRE